VPNIPTQASSAVSNKGVGADLRVCGHRHQPRLAWRHACALLLSALSTEDEHWRGKQELFGDALQQGLGRTA
jgi:hypothetical protein